MCTKKKKNWLNLSPEPNYIFEKKLASSNSLLFALKFNQNHKPKVNSKQKTVKKKITVQKINPKSKTKSNPNNIIT